MLAKRMLGIHFSLTSTHFGRELNMLNLDTHIHFAFGLVYMLSARSRGARILDLLQIARLFIRRQSGSSHTTLIKVVARILPTIMTAQDAPVWPHRQMEW